MSSDKATAVVKLFENGELKEEKTNVGTEEPKRKKSTDGVSSAKKVACR